MDLFTIRNKRRYSLNWITAEVKHCREICPVFMFYNTDIFLCFPLAVCVLLIEKCFVSYIFDNK